MPQAGSDHQAFAALNCVNFQIISQIQFTQILRYLYFHLRHGNDALLA